MVGGCLRPLSPPFLVQVDNAWWVDAAGAIVISLIILYRWFDIAKGQVEKIVGSAAPQVRGSRVAGGGAEGQVEKIVRSAAPQVRGGRGVVAVYSEGYGREGVWVGVWGR